MLEASTHITVARRLQASESGGSTSEGKVVAEASSGGSTVRSGAGAGAGATSGGTSVGVGLGDGVGLVGGVGGGLGDGGSAVVGMVDSDRGGRRGRARGGGGRARVGEGESDTVLLAEHLSSGDDLVLLGVGALLLDTRLDLGDQSVLLTVALEVGELAAISLQGTEEAVDGAGREVVELRAGGSGQGEDGGNGGDLHYDGV